MSARLPPVDKVCPVVLRQGNEGTEILVFRHPLAGVQLVKGTREAGESIAQAALRELAEESGITSGAVIGPGAAIMGHDAAIMDHDAAIFGYGASIPNGAAGIHHCAAVSNDAAILGDDAAIMDHDAAITNDAAIIRDLGSSTDIVQGQVWHFCRVEAGPLPAHWVFDTTDDGGHRFSFFWWPLLHDPTGDWHESFARALHHIRAVL